MSDMQSALITAAVASVASPDATKPCADHNPALWSLWCALRDRNPLAPSQHWTEADVLTSLRKTLECKPPN